MNTGALSEEKLLEVDKRMEKLLLPSDIGRLARKISKSYKCMKADEWKHWTLVYSMFSLRGILSTSHLNIWCLFVNACSLICSRSITTVDVEKAHELLKMFCQLFLRKYGREHCVPNMHLALHLKECIFDYGSVYGFWCFSFERYNGTLGKYHTNNHSLTIQIMRKFVSGSQLNNEELPEHSGMLQETVQNMISLNDKDTILGIDLEFFCERIVSVAHKFVLPSVMLSDIQKLFNVLYGQEIRVSPFVKKFCRVDFCNNILATKKYRGTNSPYSQVIALYPGEAVINNISEMEKRPAIITELLQVMIVKHCDGKDVSVSHIIADCKFLRQSQYKNHFGVNNPVKLWCVELEESCIIPIKFISGRFVCCKEEVQVETIRNVPVHDLFNLVICLPSKSIV